MSAKPTWSSVINALLGGENLDTSVARWAMSEIMVGAASSAQIAGFLIALRAKGETVDELGGLATEMLDHAVAIDLPGRFVDIVGTGGDRAHTVNISTMASLVIAGAGVRVVKHGNRAASSSSGSADVLAKLGVRLDLPVKRVRDNALKIGITFCFAQTFHPAMRFAAAPRREVGVTTAFNFLGPLTNPAMPAATAVGVADRRMAPLVAGVFAQRQTDALVFRGTNGLDELAAASPCEVWEVREGLIIESKIDPAEQLGLQRIEISDLRGADPEHNAVVARAVLAGEPGPIRETVALNAAAAIVADGTLEGVRPGDGDLLNRLRAGMDIAATSIDSGAAQTILDEWSNASR